MLPFETVRKIMKNITNNYQISDKAIAIMAIYIEKHIENITKKSLEIFEEINNLRGKQGLRKYKRLDEKSVEKVIRYINHKFLFNLSRKQIGGIEKRIENENKKIEKKIDSMEIT